MGDAASGIEDLERENSLLKGNNKALKAEKQCGRRFATFALCAGIGVGVVCKISWAFASWALFIQLIQIFLLSGPSRFPVQE